jgi:TolA-binding protein
VAQVAAIESLVGGYLKAGRIDELQALCEKVSASAPGSEQDLVARQGLAEIYILNRQGESAANAVNDMIAAFGGHPRIARAVCEAGDAYRRTRQFSDAEQWYAYVVQNFRENPYSMWSQKNLCTLYAQLGDEAARDAAVDELVTRYSAHPELPLAICAVGDEVVAVRKDYDKARALYEYVAANLADNEQSIWAQKNLCRLLLERVKDTQAAAAAVDVLLRQFGGNPNLPAAALEVADAWRSGHHLAESRNMYRHILENFPQSVQAVWARKNLCAISIEEGDEAALDENIAALLRDFGAHKDAPAALCGIGDLCAEAGMFEKARTLYEQVVAAYPGNEAALWARKDLCLLEIRKGRSAEADAAIERLAKDFAADDRLPQQLCELGDAWRRNNDATRARAMYQSVIHTWPGHIWALWSAKNLIAMDIALDELNAAPRLGPLVLGGIERFMADYATYPDMTSAVCLLGEVYYKGGMANWKTMEQRERARIQFGKALEVFDKVIAQSPFDAVFTPDAYYMSAAAYSRLGDYTKAIAYHKTIVENWPEHQLAWSSQYWIGTFYEKLRWTSSIPREEADAKSEQAFLILFEKYPGNPMTDSARSQLGMIYFKSNQWEKAAGVYEEIIKASPPGEKVPKSINYLAQVYERLGQREMAVLAYEAFLADWPDSTAAAYARSRLAKLGGQD